MAKVSCYVKWAGKIKKNSLVNIKSHTFMHVQGHLTRWGKSANWCLDILTQNLNLKLKLGKQKKAQNTKY